MRFSDRGQNHLTNCIVNGGAGIHRLQEFAEFMGPWWATKGYDSIDQKILKQDPQKVKDQDEYFTTWDRVVGNARLLESDGTTWRLEEDDNGNIFVVRVVHNELFSVNWQDLRTAINDCDIDSVENYLAELNGMDEWTDNDGHVLDDDTKVFADMLKIHEALTNILSQIIQEK